MTTEAVNLNRCISMAGLTKFPLRIHRQVLAGGGLVCVTVNTAGQTVTWRSNTLMYSQIALVCDELKMISTHDFHRLNAHCSPFAAGTWGVTTSARGGYAKPQKNESADAENVSTRLRAQASKATYFPCPCQSI